MANILSNFEGWGPTEVAYNKKKCTGLTVVCQSTDGVPLLTRLIVCYYSFIFRTLLPHLESTRELRRMKKCGRNVHEIELAHLGINKTWAKVSL